MYLIDTNVVSELRRCEAANPGVRRFFIEAGQQQTPLFLSAITLGELRRGVELIRHRGDHMQANLLESWLNALLVDFTSFILPFDEVAAQLWGGSGYRIRKTPWISRLQPRHWCMVSLS